MVSNVDLAILTPDFAHLPANPNWFLHLRPAYRCGGVQRSGGQVETLQRGLLIGKVPADSTARR